MSIFIRNEATYLVSNSTAERLVSAIPERLSQAVEQVATWVRTVYLDDLNYSYSRQIAANPGNSTKLRVRCYGNSPSAAPYVWVEVKRKAGEQVVKTRFRTVLASLGGLLSSEEDGGEASPVDYNAKKRFLQLKNGTALRPVALVEYCRRALETPDGSIRVTFDRCVVARRPPEDIAAWYGQGSLTGNVPPCSLVSGQVVEVKVRSGASLAADVAELLPVQARGNFSKAAAALGALGLLGSEAGSE